MAGDAPAAPVTRYLDRLRRGLLFLLTLTRLGVPLFTEPFVSTSIDAAAFWAVVHFTVSDSVGCLPLRNGVIDSSTITRRQLSSRSVCCIGNQCPFKHICPAFTFHCTSCASSQESPKIVSLMSGLMTHGTSNPYSSNRHWSSVWPEMLTCVPLTATNFCLQGRISRLLMKFSGTSESWLPESIIARRGLPFRNNSRDATPGVVLFPLSRSSLAVFSFNSGVGIVASLIVSRVCSSIGGSSAPDSLGWSPSCMSVVGDSSHQFSGTVCNHSSGPGSSLGTQQARMNTGGCTILFG